MLDRLFNRKKKNTATETLLQEIKKKSPSARNVRALIAEGADIHIKDNRGYTPLLFAAQGNHPDIVQSLIQAGARIDNRGSDGMTPLMWAAQHGQRSLVRLLMKKAAYRFWRDEEGKTATDHARENNHPEIAALIEQHTGLSDVFNKFAQKAAADFPHLKEKMTVYHASTDTIYTGDGRSIENTSNGRREAAAIGRDSDWAAYAQHYAQNIVYVLATEDTRTFTTLDSSFQKDVSATLEHELGHLVAPGGFGRGTFSECVADTFSFIRQRQDGQPIAASIEYKNWKSARNLILEGRASHFTLPVIDELMRLSQEHDLSGLTPAQTANLAYRLALQYVPSQDFLKQATEIYAPVKNIDGTLPPIERHQKQLEKCAEIMFVDHGEMSDAIFNLGKTMLEPYFDRKMDCLLARLPKDEVDVMKLEGVFWDDIRQKIKDRTAAIVETPGQIETRRLNYLQALGCFDPLQEQEALLNAKQYERPETAAVILDVRRAHAASPPQHKKAA